MKATLIDLFTSKKFLAALTAVIVYLAGRFGFNVDPTALDHIWQALLVYVGAQGLADVGKGAAQVREAAFAALPPRAAPAGLETGAVLKAPTVAVLALVVLGLASAGSLTGCAATASTVRTEAVTLEGCSAADAVAIVTASAKIVDDVKATDHVMAAIDAIGQLATIHAAWSRCKGAAPPTVPPVPAASSAS